MTDLFLQIGLSNACFSLFLAVLAMVVGAKGRRARLAYMVWLLVFIKLVTPPIVGIPIIAIPGEGETGGAVSEHLQPGSGAADNPGLAVDGETDALVSTGIALAAVRYGREWFPPVWLLGSVIVFGWSMVTVLRFMRLLSVECKAAPGEVQRASVEIAGRLGLKRTPAIHTTSARLSPLVWWVGGKVRIVLPSTLLGIMDAEQWRWVLAHELAHVRRRDYLVRWLEWAACVCFWWNPVVWWAQRNLRAAEEICCDELVISCLEPKPKIYANSLLSAVEFLARPVLRAPAMASEINSGGFLERRFKMIVSNKSKRSNSRWLQIVVLLCAVVVLPLGIASAADYEAVGKRLRAAVQAGELTADEARIMMGALRRTAQQGERRRGAGGAEQSEYEGFARRIKAVVAEGKMTPEEGREQLAGFRRRTAMAGRGERERGERGITVEEYKRAEEKMRKMVEEGKAKPEDVERRLIEMRKMIGERGERSRGERSISVEEYKRAEAKMRKMVEEGKAKPEDVERRLSGMRKMMGEWGERGEKERDPKAEYDAAVRKIKAAIAAGDITEEQGKARLEGMRKRMGGDSKRVGRDEYSEAAREIREAVAAGKITKEQGREKLSAVRKQIGAKKEGAVKKKGREGQAKKDVDWEGIKKRIESAVKSGKMTRKEADAKYEAIKKRMSGGEKR